MICRCTNRIGSYSLHKLKGNKSGYQEIQNHAIQGSEGSPGDLNGTEANPQIIVRGN